MAVGQRAKGSLLFRGVALAKANQIRNKGGNKYAYKNCTCRKPKLRQNNAF